jgi:hypothetical protein
MLDTQQRSTGTRYTTTVALLMVALLFIPAVLIAYRATGVYPILLAVAASASCLAWARFQWKCRSALTIPSIATEITRAK